MVKVKFTAKPGLPDKKGGRRWLHKKTFDEPHVDEETGVVSVRRVEAVWFESGETYEVTPWEAKVLTTVPPYDACFEVVGPDPPPSIPIEPSPMPSDAFEAES